MSKVRDLRLAKGIPAKAMVECVRKLYPKFDAPTLSKCESGAYGVDLPKDALEALYAEFAPDQAGRSADRHKKSCRIAARLDDSTFAAVTAKIKANGYASIQDWLTDMVEQYLREESN